MWARFDDEYDDNPKCRAIGKDGRALDSAGIRWCAKHLNDGVIPDHDLPLVAAKAEVQLKRTLRRLAEAGRWHGPSHDCDRCPPCPPGHHVVHDFLAYNPDAEKEREKKRMRAEAGRKGGLKSRPPGSKPEANASAKTQAEHEAETKQIGTPSPYPTDLHPPPTHVGTRPEPAEEGTVVDQAICLAAARHAQHQMDRGKGDNAEGLARWWRQQNEQGARIRAHKLLDDHDLTATQLADVLATATDPSWLRSYRRRQPPAEPVTDDDLASVAAIQDGIRNRLRHPHTQESA